MWCERHVLCKDKTTKLSELTKQTSDKKNTKMKNCFLRKTKENKNSTFVAREQLNAL